jgi:hypothetical protein
VHGGVDEHQTEQQRAAARLGRERLMRRHACFLGQLIRMNPMQWLRRERHEVTQDSLVAGYLLVGGHDDVGERGANVALPGDPRHGLILKRVFPCPSKRE